MEQRDKAIENQKEDRKAEGKFWIILILSGIGGGIVGYLGVVGVRLMQAGEMDFQTWAQTCTTELVKISVQLLPMLVLLMIPVLIYRTIRHGNEVKAGQENEDEIVFEKLNERLGMDLNISSVLSMLIVLLWGMAYYGMMQREKIQMHYFVGDLLSFIGGLIVLVYYQKRTVNLIKELNPEMQGSVLDMQFAKKWYASYDEAQKQQVGRAAYETYRVMNGVYIAMDFGLMITGFFLPIGILPFILVTLLWMAQSITYMVKTRKLV